MLSPTNSLRVQKT